MFNFRSKFLQLVGLNAVKALVRVFEELLIDAASDPVYLGERERPDFLRVARGDLAVDVHQSRSLRWEDLRHFVCQSRNTDIFTTLTDLSRKQLLDTVSERENWVTPPMDNKGVSIRKPGPLELAAASVLDAYADALREELAEGKRGGSVTRSVMQGREPKTVYFGKYTQPIFCKVYDKLASLRPQKKLYMLDVWADQGWDGNKHVWRWEFTFTGDFLKSVYVGEERVDVRELDVFLAYVPALWFYVSRKWLRQVEREDNKETHRHATTLYWALIQTAWDSPVGVRRDHSREIRCKDDADKERRIEELEAQARGCMVSASALKASRVTDLEQLDAGRHFDPTTGEIRSVRDVVLSDVQAWMDEEFDLDVYHRRREIGVDDLSDSALTALQRAVRMMEGTGS